MNSLYTMLDVFFRYYTCNNEVKKMANRTEQQWTALYDAAVTAIIEGRCANSYFGDYSIESIVSEAVSGADRLIKELKEREDTEQ